MSLPNNAKNLFKINLPLNAKLVTTPPFEFGIQGRGAYDYEWIYVCACIFAFVCAGRWP